MKYFGSILISCLLAISFQCLSQGNEPEITITMTIEDTDIDFEQGIKKLIDSESTNS